MNGDEIRTRFLKYFEERGHRAVASSPVIPADDPTLLFTNAGMNQFKDLFLGLDKRQYNRAATVQKCIRAGGKHNDLELVGRTARHLTFFEMLGNFSVGDSFKEEAIEYAWRFLLDEVGLPEEKLWVSVYKEDDESEKIWKQKIGLPSDRIYKLGEKDNFWSMGDTGPCGPCTEMGIDQGSDFGCGQRDCDVGCECDRYLELWNLVFMQYDRESSGRLAPLPEPSVDTGMGLERLASVLQKVPSNFDTDLLAPLIRRIGEISGREYAGENVTSFRVIADHVRTLIFAIVDGIVPSNEARGYVLRRILRRASRHGRMIDIDGPFLYRLVGDLVEIMGHAYPELTEGSEGAKRIIKAEEERFGQTLDQGLILFEKMIADLGSSRVIPGDKAFLLYDTYGFPLDLTAAMAEEQGLLLDVEGFEKMMAHQREQARGEKKSYGRIDLQDLGIAPVEFTGYESLTGKGKVQRIEVKGEAVQSSRAGDQVAIDLTSTPFYGESGGQMGDSGTLKRDGLVIEVSCAKAVSVGRIVHIGRIEEGVLRTGDELSACVDEERRCGLRRSHTATHLLHYALREVLGGHIKQAGSLVGPDRLRFDFTHYSPVSSAELHEIESMVQQKIVSNGPVSITEMSYPAARKMGALAFFGEKYGERVRVVDVDGFSRELCGGTHVRSSGDIGMMVILSESSISAGTRRIEGLVGLEAYRFCADLRTSMNRAASLLKVPPENVARRIEELKNDVHVLEREIRELSLSKARDGMKIKEEDVELAGDIPLLVRRVEVGDVESLRALADDLRGRLDSGVGVLGAVLGGKAMLVVTVSRDLVEEKGLSASEIIGRIARVVGGRGGGRPEMAQAGGKDWEKLDEALESAGGVVREIRGR